MFTMTLIKSTYLYTISILMSTQMFTINAFKYTYMYTLIFEVSDSGIGINEEQLSRIFYRFKQMLIDKIMHNLASAR
jgi:K+-sensing histidine kinase KdpD